MMYCKQCGAEIRNGSIFCSKCGSKITEADQKEDDMLNKNVVLNNIQLETEMHKDNNKLNNKITNAIGSLRNNKPIIIVVCALIIVLVSVSLISRMISGRNKINNNEAYIKSKNSTVKSSTPNSDSAKNTQTQSGNTNASTTSPQITNNSEVQGSTPNTDSNSANNTSTLNLLETNDEDKNLENRFIFTDSDKRKLTQSEVSGLAMFELSLARNEIFARHGHVFQNDKLKVYFTYKKWYSENTSWNDVQINEIEKYNVDLIKQEEENRNKVTNSNEFITVAQAWNNLTKLNLNANRQPDLGVIETSEIYGESFYIFSAALFNADGYEGDFRYVVSKVTGNIYKYCVTGDMILLAIRR